MIKLVGIKLPDHTDRWRYSWVLSQRLCCCQEFLPVRQVS